MSQKGFAHIVPIILIAVLVSSIGIASTIRSENVQKQQVGKVLSEKGSQEEENESQQKANEAAKDAAEKQAEAEKKASENSSKNSNTISSSNKTKTVSRTQDSETEVETENGKTKVKVKNQNGEFETEIEEGKEKTKFQSNNFKIEFEREGDKFVAKIKNEDGEEAELEASEEAELFDELENELDDDDIEIATGSAQLGFIQKGNKVRTNFPLSVNPSTGELFVTTPNGIKVVTVLPDTAIQNMIKAGVITRTEDPAPPTSTNQESTQSSLGVEVENDLENASVELTELNKETVYIIKGVKDQRFLGVLPVEIKVKTTVSTTDGHLLDITEGFFSRILDLLSF